MIDMDELYIFFGDQNQFMVCIFFIILEPLPAAVLSYSILDTLIPLLNELVYPHVRQFLSHFLLHIGFLFSCFQLVMFAVFLMQDSFLEVPMSVLYETYFVVIHVVNGLWTNMPPNSVSPIIVLVVQSLVSLYFKIFCPTALKQDCVGDVV